MNRPGFGADLFQQLFRAGMVLSIGSVDDSFASALTETTIGLYETEAVRDDSPFRTGPIRTLANLEELTSAWVDLYNTRRLMHRLGRIPPVEAEAVNNAATSALQPEAAHT